MNHTNTDKPLGHLSRIPLLQEGEIKENALQDRSSSALTTYTELCKVKIAAFSALSAATGYVLAGTVHSLHFLLTVSGVFLLACGACALNQYQERHSDALMERTKNRPLPAGKIKPFHAFFFSIALLMAGFTALSFTGHTVISGIGLFALVWYNGFYTWFKRKSAFAAIPGALIGALPPAMGWAAAGGDVQDTKLLALCFIFFMWQIPHFWLLFLSNKEDYERAGLPSLNGLFSESQITRITCTWNFSLATACLLIPLFRISSSPAVSSSLAAAALWLAIQGWGLLQQKNVGSDYHRLFKHINIYILLVMLLLNLDGLFMG